jgi:hypothetical protein
MVVVSTDHLRSFVNHRIREELAKAMKVDTWGTLKVLQSLPEALVQDWLERPGMWLMPTTRQPGNPATR